MVNTDTSSRNTTSKTARLAVKAGETILLAITIIGVALKFLGQGTSIIVIAGLSSLAFFYMFIGALFEIAEKPYSNNQSKIIHGAIGVSFAILLMGILFRLQMWPNMFGLLLIPLLVFVIATAIFSLIKPDIIDKQVGKWTLPRIALIAVPVLFFAMHSDSEYYALQGPYRNDPKFMELFTACKEQRERCDEYRAYHDSLWVLEHGEWRNTNP